MAPKRFPSLAATAFAAMLFHFFLKRRSREINRGEANSSAAANDGTAGGDSSTHCSTEGPGMAISSGYDYEVFLSFRGPDTRAAFTDFLYISLEDVGIRVYKDDKDLREGEEFGPELLQAIKQSKISIPIFSKDYASSVWCLKEAVQMVECKKNGGQKIIPIFYDVAPAEVRHQIGDYKNAFFSHESKKRYDHKTIEEWKAALSAIGDIKGYDLQSMPNRREGEFVKTFVREVLEELKKPSLAVSDYLVNVDNHVDAIIKMIGAGTSETRMIGIHGMGGIGKTTIAKIIFNKLSHDFEHRSFLCDIQEMSKKNGIECLQNQLISDILKMKFMDIKYFDEGTRTIKDRLFNKRVLLLLDDVKEENHIDAFVGKPHWLGKGSKIIITTRRIDVLYAPEVDGMYEVTGMDPDQSLQLFSKHAFKKDSPLVEYVDQSNRVIKIAGGLPLALEVIGSLLCCTKKEMWDERLKMLESVPDDKIQSKLKISYDVLDNRQKHIFLDIACFFIGYDKNILVHFWDESNFFPKVAIEDLQTRSLIKIEENNKVWMHDQLRDFGREMVRQESEMNIEKQRRVWDPKEALDLLRRHEAKKEVEALHLKFDHDGQYHFTYEGFMGLSNLRFLAIDCSMENFHVEERLLWHESPLNILPRLRWLSWHRIPPALKITNFSMENVVILDLSKSKIMHDWEGWSHMKVMKNLKILNLSKCNCLERIPIFFAHSNLERLILRDCESLIEIDESISQLKCLVFLDVSYCKNLQRLPDELGDLASLEYLSLRECKSLERLPNTIGNLKLLIELDISNCQRLKRTPNFSTCSNLERLILSGCKSLIEIDRSICQLKSLVSLDVSHCRNLQRLPGELGGDLASLEYLSLSECKSLEKLSDTIGNLKSLIELDISNCQRLKSTPNFYAHSNLERLILSGCESLIKINKSICQLKRLVSLNVSDCKNLQRLPDELGGDLASLEYLSLSECKSLEKLPDTIGNLESLIKLDISKCQRLKRTPKFCAYSNLERLILSNCTSLIEIDRSICQLKRLVSLDVSHCKNLQRLPDELGEGLASLEYLSLKDCTSLKKLPDTIENLESLIELDISNTRIKELPDSIGKMKRLKVVKMRDSDISNIPDSLWMSEKLEEIEASKAYHPKRFHVNQTRKRSGSADTYKLPSRLPESLIKVRLYNLPMNTFPDLSNFTNLKELNLTFTVSYSIGRSYGAIEDPIPRWIGNLTKLESLHLSFYRETASPTDLSLPPQLKSLQLMCPKLRRLPRLPSSLSSLSLFCCTSLCSMEDLSNLKNLSSLNISNTAITEIQDLGCLKNLSSLNISNAAIIEIQDLGCLENLEYFSLLGLPRLERLPDLRNLKNLRSLQVSNCCSLFEIQGELPWLLDSLHIFSCPSLQKLPDLSSRTVKRNVDINFCSKLNVEAIISFSRMNPQYLQLVSCNQLQILPDLSNSNELRRLKVSCCDNLNEIQGELPQSLEELEISSCVSLQKLPNLSSLKELRRVKINCCRKLNVEALLRFAQTNPLELQSDEPGRLQVENLGYLVEIQGQLPNSLEKLDISFCESLYKLPNLSSFVGLQEVCISSCDRLIEIQGELPQSLEELKISSCKSLQKLPDLSSLKGLRRVKINHCGKLNVEAILGFAWNNSDKPRRLQVENYGNLVEIQGKLLQSLEELKISSCESLQKLYDLSSLMGLREVCISTCGSLVEIQGKLPQFLEKLKISSCKSLRKLPDLSNLMRLQGVCISTCGSLVEIQGELPQSLEELKISCCESLQKFPDLSSLKRLRRLRIDHCEKLNVVVNSWRFSEKLVKFVAEYDEYGINSESEYETDGEDEE